MVQGSGHSYGSVAELADAHDLESCSFGSAGSRPVGATYERHRLRMRIEDCSDSDIVALEHQRGDKGTRMGVEGQSLVLSVMQEREARVRQHGRTASMRCWWMEVRILSRVF